MKQLSMLIVALMLSSCASPGAKPPIHIDARTQKIAVQSLTGLTRSVPDALLPPGQWDRDILQNELDEVRTRLVAELHRGERFGQYSVVDSTEPAGIIIGIDLLDVTVAGDTITFPFEITVTNRILGTTMTQTITSRGICEETPPGAGPERTAVLRTGSALMDNARNFPVATVAAWFHIPGQGIIAK